MSFHVQTQECGDVGGARERGQHTTRLTRKLKLKLFLTDKEEACTRLAQLPCTSKRDTEELLIGMLGSLRVKCRAHR